ncbi:unnamed protein product [Trichobilharzia szidati]|nr:unnamed protein product [Trichobilharzia szidati]
MADNSSASEMAITLQLPTFWTHHPVAWFDHIEAMFALRNIHSQETKVNLVTVSLPENVMEEVSDVLADRSPGLYERLKQALIKRVALNDQQKVQELFRDVQLGDRKPTQLLRQMRQLVADSKIDDDFLKQLWLQRLPQAIQTILAPINHSPLSELAEAADRVVETATSNTNISAAVTASPTQTKNSFAGGSSNVDVVAHITKLYEEICKLRIDRRPRGRSNSRTSSTRGRSSSRAGSRRCRPKNSQPGVCWYHRRYGDKAQKCTRPCIFDVQQSGNQ